MVFPAHRRLSFTGCMGSYLAPWEKWSFRLNLGVGEGGGDPAALLAVAAASWTNRLDVLCQQVAKLTEVKYAEIGADGLYTADPVILPVTPGSTSSGTVMQPPQIALAVSLLTDRRGPTGRGRFYLPVPVALTSPADGLIPSVDAIAASTGAAGFLSDLNGPAGFGNVSVVSSKGYLTPVNAVRVGRVLDTIRSRRTSVLESYTPDVAVTS